MSLPENTNRRNLVKAVNQMLPISAGPGVSVSSGSNGTTISADIRPDDRNYFVGLVVCDGPRGADPRFDDQRYWVKRAQLTNDNNNPDDARTETADWEEVPSTSPWFLHVMAENLFETNCETHYVRPQTVVLVYEEKDPAGQSRYFFSVADEGTCNDDCGSSSSSQSQSSSSSSSSSSSTSSSTSTSGSGSTGSPTCIWVWTCDYDCADNGWDDVTPAGFACEVPPPQVNQWVQQHGCKYIYYQTGHPCSSPGDCGNRPLPPDGPNFTPNCCSSSAGSGSLSQQCVWTWLCKFHCTPGVPTSGYWGNVDFLRVDCEVPPPQTEQWVQLLGCTYAYYHVGANCPGDTETEGCGPRPTDPRTPNFYPNCCSSSSSSSGSSSSSTGGCNCARKTVTVVTDVSCVDGSIHVTKQDIVVFDDGSGS